MKKIENFQELGIGKGFLGWTPKTQSLKRKIDKLDLIKI